MSFLKDPSLLKEFANILKQAQTPAPGPAPSALSVAKYLMIPLGQQLNGMPNLQITGDEASPKTSDLNNIEVLIQYLERNNVNIDGHKLVYKASEFKLDPMQAQYYGSIGTKVSKDPSIGGADKENQWNEVGYRVYLPGLYEYVKYLQRKADNEDNKVLKTMVSKLIDQVNNKFITDPKDKLSKTPRATPGAPTGSTVDPKAQLDSFPDNFLFNAWAKDISTGNVSLLASDLESVGSLNAWLKDHGAKVKTETFKDGKKVYMDLPWDNKDANRCNIAQVLFNRAKAKSTTYTSEADKTKITYYLNKVKELSAQMVGPDDKPCQLVGVGAIATPGTESATGTKPATGTGQELYNLLQRLPFLEDYIDIQRFKQFNAAYLDMASGDHKAQLTSMINNVTSKILELDTLSSRAGIPRYPLPYGAGAAEQYSAYAKYPQADYIGRLLAELKMLIVLEKAVVGDLIVKYGSGGPGSVGATSAILTPEQIQFIRQDLDIAEDNLKRLSAIIWEWQTLQKGK